ncbi:MAG: hypothetical protein ABR575_06600, partial [Actinomycetota bacterium]
KRLNWRFRFRSWIAQEGLLDGPLAPYRDQVVAYARRDPGVIDEAILMWNALHHVIDGYRAARADWRFVRHEDMARSPVTGFRSLYEDLGLRWSEDVSARIARHSHQSNPKEVGARRHGSVRRDSAAAATSWTTRLPPEEIERVLQGTAEVATRFYSEDELAP